MPGKVAAILIANFWEVRLRLDNLAPVEELGSTVRPHERGRMTRRRALPDHAEHYRRLGLAAWELPPVRTAQRSQRSPVSDREIARLISEGISRDAIMDRLRVGLHRYYRVRRLLLDMAKGIDDGEEREDDDTARGSASPA